MNKVKEWNNLYWRAKKDLVETVRRLREEKRFTIAQISRETGLAQTDVRAILKHIKVI